MYGALGYGDTLQRGASPATSGDALPVVDLGTGRTALRVASAEYSSCALLSDLTIKCWGYNEYGELGHGDTIDVGDKPDQMGDQLMLTDVH
jgi:hypothetical protein